MKLTPKEIKRINFRSQEHKVYFHAWQDDFYLVATINIRYKLNKDLYNVWDQLSLSVEQLREINGIRHIIN